MIKEETADNEDSYRCQITSYFEILEYLRTPNYLNWVKLNSKLCPILVSDYQYSNQYQTLEVNLY